MKPFVSMTQDRLYFTAYDAHTRATQIWFVTRTQNGWSEAQHLVSPINDDRVFYLNQGRQDDVYFTNIAKRKMYYAQVEDGHFPSIEPLPIEFGTQGFIAPSGDAWISMTPMNGSQLETGIIDGNISEAELFGRTVREARKAGKDPIAELVKVAHGYKLFEGVVVKSDVKGDRGFNWVEAEFMGIGEFQDQSYRVFVKNENIIGWLNGRIDAMAPDYIYNPNPETGESTLGVGYGGYVVGEKVSLIAVPAPAQWRSEKGVKLIGPRHFGFDFDYIPIEQLQQQNSGK